MLDIMYEIPSKAHVKECIIDRECHCEEQACPNVYRTEEEIKAI